MMNVTYIEDVLERPVDPAAVLTDEQLRDGGLAKVDAFVRTKASKNALRQQRHKEKQEAAGIKQLNVMMPETAHDTIKQLVARVKEGATVDEALKSMGRPAAESQPDLSTERLVGIGRKVESLTGWKRALAKLLGIAA